MFRRNSTGTKKMKRVSWMLKAEDRLPPVYQCVSLVSRQVGVVAHHQCEQVGRHDFGGFKRGAGHIYFIDSGVCDF